jgi:hypothetical protein
MRQREKSTFYQNGRISSIWQSLDGATFWRQICERSLSFASKTMKGKLAQLKPDFGQFLQTLE